MSTFVEEQRGVNRPENGTIAKGFPTQAIFRVQHYLKRIWTSALALAGAEQDVQGMRSSASVWVRNEHNRVQALLWKIAVPNLKLGLHSGPITQPESISSSSLSRSTVK
jgi:hypothetical protein